MSAEKSPPNDGSSHVEQERLDHNVAVAATLPSGTSDESAKLRDIWENKRVLGFCMLIYLLPINFGFEMGTLGKLYAVTPFAQRFGFQVGDVWVMNVKDQQLLGGSGTIGIFFSALIVGFVADLIGRKKTIAIACVVCMGGVILQYYSTSIMMLFGGKLIATLGFGLGHSLAPVFVAELAPVKLRGICLSLVNTMIMLGGWLNSIVVLGCEHYHNDMSWRIPLITQLIPPGLLLIGLVFLPESPAWLLINGHDEKAAAAFRRYNGPRFDVDGAMAVARMAIANEQGVKREQEGVTYLDCFRGTNRRRTLITVCVYTSQQFIGVTFITGYLTYYFRLAGVNSPLAVGQGAFAIQIAGNIVSWFLIDNVGRRPMFVGGAWVMTALLLLIGGISTIGSNQALLATTALMCLWGFLYQMTLGAVAYAICAETPSIQLRQKTYSVDMMVSTAVSCLIIQTTPYMINTDKANLGGKICFIFFGLSLPMCVWLFLSLPELKGRNYAEVQEMFTNKVPARKFKSYVCEVSNTQELNNQKMKEDEA